MNIEAALFTTKRRYLIARLVSVTLLVLAGLSFSAVMLVLVLSVRQSQDSITSCTEPPGACYQRSIDNQQRNKINTRNVLRLCEATPGVKCEDPEAPRP